MDMVRLDPPAELTMPIGEAMFSQRAMRRMARWLNIASPMGIVSSAGGSRRTISILLFLEI